MDQHLKLLAGASLAITEADEAVVDGAFHHASERLDGARDGLAELRGRWSAMTAAERRLVGDTARPVRQRLDAVAARIPRLCAVSEMAGPVLDSEQDADPDADLAESPDRRASPHAEPGVARVGAAMRAPTQA